MKGFLFGTLEACRNAELEKFRECMHCEDSECFRERVERREDCETTDLDDGAASLEDDLVSLWRRDNRVNRRMACPRDGIADDILLEIQLQLQILKTLERRGVKQSIWRKKYALLHQSFLAPPLLLKPFPVSNLVEKECAALRSIENHRRELRSTMRVVFDYSLRVTLSLL